MPTIRAPIDESSEQVKIVTSADSRGTRSVPTSVNTLQQNMRKGPTPLQQRMSAVHSWRPAVICAQASASQRLRSYSPSPERAALPTRAISPSKYANDTAAPPPQVMTPRGERPARSSMHSLQVPSAPSAAPATCRVVRATSVPMLSGPLRAMPSTSASSSSSQITSNPGTPRHSGLPIQTCYRPVEVVSYHAAGGQARRLSGPSRSVPGAASAQVPLSPGFCRVPPPPAGLPQAVSSRYVSPGLGVSLAQAVPASPPALAGATSVVGAVTEVIEQPST